MPALPKLLADLVEPRFARACRIAHIERLAQRLHRVRFEGPELRDLSFRPGQEVEIRVDATSFRHYTPARYERGGAIEVLFYLHGFAPGTTWVRGLEVGAAARLLGPGGRFALADARTHVLLGDETCLGLFAALAAAAPITQHVRGAIEVDPACEDWPRRAGVALDAVTRYVRGASLGSWLERASLDPASDTAIYLAGHAATIRRLRDQLRTAGWRGGAIRTRPYWADGKRGL
ncbi:MAG: siderophore-interacting protein [Deltaproteobacteria bacterium]|nr:siderophore-interacting protein [Deltaproteobacteria bacterium]